MIISPLKQENKFPVFNFNFGSDLMRFNFLIVLTMVLCAFCVLPVNATNYNIDVDLTFEGSYFSKNIEIDYGAVSENSTVTLHFLNYDVESGNCILAYQGTNIVMGTGQNPPSTYTIELLNAPCTFRIFGAHPLLTPSYDIYYTINFYHGGNVPNDYNIDIDLQEQTLELGIINSLEQTFYIGSSSDRVVKNYLTYSATSCTIEDIQRNFVKVKFNKNFLDDSEIYLSGYALKDTTESDFNTYVKFNFTYIEGMQAFIQTYDYQNGNMLSGVNISVYEVIEGENNLELGNLIYTSSNSESQTILNLKQDTEYFVKNEKTGYFSVKNTVYDSLNGEIGYLWNPSIENPLRLYYSRLDASAQYNANFIVQDVNNNGISGVSVTMDNAVTKISNSIGGLTFSNISAGQHTFVFVKNGYQTAQRTIDIQLQYAAFYQTMFKDSQIIQPTAYPTGYPTIQPTLQPTYTPIDQPSNLAESVKYGLAKMFGVNSLNTINLIFALMIILFPAVVAGVITNQALGFIAGGLIGFVFALGIGLIPIWVFFSMIMLSVIYLVMTHTESGF